MVLALHHGLCALGVFDLLELVAIDGVVVIFEIFVGVIAAIFDKPDGCLELVCAIGPLYGSFGCAHNFDGVQKSG